MTKSTALTLLVSAVVFAPPAAAGLDALGPYDFELEKGKVKEVCVHIAAGQSRKYHWSSDAATDFNIHYHKGDDVFYPVKKDGAQTAKGIFKAKTSEDYCLMWTAKERAKVRGSLTE